MSDIALTVSVLALVAVVGLWIGNIKVRGVGFGIGGVLFGGIIVGHFVDQAGVTLSGDMHTVTLPSARCVRYRRRSIFR